MLAAPPAPPSLKLLDVVYKQKGLRSFLDFSHGQVEWRVPARAVAYDYRLLSLGPDWRTTQGTIASQDCWIPSDLSAPVLPIPNLAPSGLYELAVRSRSVCPPPRRRVKSTLSGWSTIRFGTVPGPLALAAPDLGPYREQFIARGTPGARLPSFYLLPVPNPLANSGVELLYDFVWGNSLSPSGELLVVDGKSNWREGNVFDTAGVATGFPWPLAGQSATYYWQVRAKYKSSAVIVGSPGPWSEIGVIVVRGSAKFNQTTGLRLKIDESTKDTADRFGVFPVDPVTQLAVMGFTWDTRSLSHSYEFQALRLVGGAYVPLAACDSASGCQCDPVSAICSVGLATSVTLSLPAGTYRLQVRARQWEATTPWSNLVNFTIQ